MGLCLNAPKAVSRLVDQYERIYLHMYLKLPISTASFVFTVKLKIECSFHPSSMFKFCKENYVNKIYLDFEDLLPHRIPPP
jgi:hypothetical protein